MNKEQALGQQNVHRVCVYGTLKKGQPNEYKMNSCTGTVFLGEVRTVEKYPLVVGTQWNLPLLLPLKSQGHNISGELYEVSEEMLKELDEFEDHPNMYEREETDVTVVKGQHQDCPTGSRSRCWVYFYKLFTDTELSLPHVDCYDVHTLKDPYDVSENPDHPSHSEHG